MDYINIQDIYRWHDIFHAGQVFEVRAMLPNSKNRLSSGYFTDVPTMLEAIRGYESWGLYSPINVVKEACWSRAQHNTMVDGATTTSKTDIERRSWIMIDLDPTRPSGVNATDAEKATAKTTMLCVGSFLRDQGFESPVVADSANGYHLYYAIDLANDTSNEQLIKSFLQVLDMQFSTDAVKIDLAVADANRLSKIIGTRSAKGSDTPDRPQRLSRFVKVPDEIKKTRRAYIEKVAAMLPQEERPSRYNGYSSDKFDLEAFCDKHGIQIAKRQRFSAGEKWILEECPFDSTHKAPDAAFFLLDNGAIGFKCLHNSCSQYTWRDVRLHFEPDAYDNRAREAFEARQDYYSRDVKQAPVIAQESPEKGKKWLSMADIKWVDPTKFTYIPTGIKEIDSRIGGLALGDVTVLSGYPGSGKSSLLDLFALNAIERGYRVAIWSGELQDFRFQAWLDQMAAGKAFVRSKAGYDNWYYAPYDICAKINAWLEGKFWLFNNDYGNKFSQIFADVKDCVEKNGTQFVCLDNLTALNLDAYSGERNDKQSAFINELKTYAKRANIHILLVAHPRKEVGNAFLRRESISGTADLANLVDNIIIAHRRGNDFERRAGEFLRKQQIDDLMRYDEVLEIAKNRSHGVVDHFIGLYFERESRRYKNDIAENIIYSWNTDYQPLPRIDFNAEVAPDAVAPWEIDDLPL